MNKFFFFIFIIGICGYLWADNHNKKQKQYFDNKAYYYEQQAKQGNLEAQKTLADLYARGIDLMFASTYGKQLQNSAYWYEQSAIQGDVGSQFMIAKIYEKGIGIEVNLQNANAWYYQAYLSGNLEAGFILANHLAQGRGIEQNHQQALFLYNELANIYYEPAIFKMGEIYYKGLFSIEKNREIALQYFQKIPNYQGVSDFDGMLSKIQREISLENAMAQKQLESQISEQQYLPNTNKSYPSEYYGHSSECTAICYDGTCSKSLGRRGVCSSHGGVKYWLR